MVKHKFFQANDSDKSKKFPKVELDTGKLLETAVKGTAAVLVLSKGAQILADA